MKPVKLLSFILLCLAIAGCRTVPKDQEHHWKAVLIPAKKTLPDPKKRVTTEGYFLYVATDSRGYDFSTAKGFIDTLKKPVQGDPEDVSVGHAWILTESPEDILECGHTGEFGILNPSYYDGMIGLVKKKDPNPISYLFTRMKDGKYHQGADSHDPTYVARIKISKKQHDDIRKFIKDYDYKIFALTDRQCSFFVAECMRIAGIDPAYEMKISFPQIFYFRGIKVRVWTDPKYKTIAIGFPDSMETFSRLLVKKGLAEDAMKWYLEE
ncbi:MAG: hypothetical protein HRT89_07880 [Lentisphaeria bacterium]|nr:hypothetical protein [Lentisphaeria bacterium]